MLFHEVSGVVSVRSSPVSAQIADVARQLVDLGHVYAEVRHDHITVYWRVFEFPFAEQAFDLLVLLRLPLLFIRLLDWLLAREALFHHRLQTIIKAWKINRIADSFTVYNFLQFSAPTNQVRCSCHS